MRNLTPNVRGSKPVDAEALPRKANPAYLPRGTQVLAGRHMKAAGIFRKVQKGLTDLSRFERWIWIGVLVVLFVSTVVRLTSAFFPQFANWASEASALSAFVFNTVGLAQSVTLTLVVALPLLRYLLTRNPAEKVAERIVKKRQPHLIKDLSSLAELGELRFPAHELEIVSDNDALKEFSRMNAECFEESANYSGDYVDKLLRNTSVHDRYPQSFAFVLDETGERMGISMVIPLNSTATHLYKRGVLSDHDVMDIHVAAKGEPCDCILLFAIGMLTTYRPAGGKADGSAAIRRLVRNHVHHIWKVASDFDLETVPFIMQVERRSILRMGEMFGFRKLEGKGADGDPLFEITWPEFKDNLGQFLDAD